MNNGRSLKEVIKLLTAETCSLKTLAYMSGYPPLTFYRSADLSGLDLSGQDLTGLNFDYADFYGSTLSDVKVDVGALNNSKLPVESMHLADDFDGYFDDAMADHAKRVYVFAKIRPGTIENFISEVGFSLAQFSEVCELSVNTLRKARNSQSIAIESVQGINKGIKGIMSKSALSNMSISSVQQPCVSFVTVNPTGGFIAINRKKFLHYTELASRLYEIRKSHNSRYYEEYRDGPAILEFYTSYPNENLSIAQILARDPEQPELF
jgi:hypothetical protein